MSRSKTSLSRHWRIRNDELPVQHLQNSLLQSLPENLGIGHTNIFQLDQDLSYIKTQLQPAKRLALFNQIDDSQPRLVVTLGLQGHSRFASKQGDEVLFNEGYATITSFNSSSGERQYEADKATLQLRLSMNKKWFFRYFGEQKTNQLFNQNGIKILSQRTISSQARIAAENLLACNVAPELSHVFMHGHALTLLASELNPLWESKKSSNYRFKQKDRNQAMAARDILYYEFKSPPSIEELAKRVGTNQFTLKKIFHHYFNNTPYGLLLEIRMNYAYQLLQSTHCQVSTAAEQVGYQYASNFSTAFTKYFGISPKLIAKQ